MYVVKTKKKKASKFGCPIFNSQLKDISYIPCALDRALFAEKVRKNNMKVNMKSSMKYKILLKASYSVILHIRIWNPIKVWDDNTNKSTHHPSGQTVLAQSLLTIKVNDESQTGLRLNSGTCIYTATWNIPGKEQGLLSPLLAQLKSDTNYKVMSLTLNFL